MASKKPAARAKPKVKTRIGDPKKRSVKRNGNGTFAPGNTGSYVGRYDPAYCDLAKKICMLLGATDQELAQVLEVSATTIYQWKNDYPEFANAIREGKIIADANVAERLYQRAIGYSHPEVHISNYQGEITITPLTKYYPPDTAACNSWLNNRQMAKWKNRRESLDIQVDDVVLRENLIGQVKTLAEGLLKDPQCLQSLKSPESTASPLQQAREQGTDT